MFCDRMMPLARVTLPLLDLKPASFGCCYIKPTVRDEMTVAATSADMADLPISFRALWLQTDRIFISVAERSTGAVLASDEEVQTVDPARELCRFLSLAPGCYEEFRLFASGEHPMLTIWAEYELPDQPVEDPFGSIDAEFSSLQDLASAMQPFAHEDSLAVSLSSDATYVHVVRVRT